MMLEIVDGTCQTILIPTRVSLRSQEYSSLVVIDAMDRPTLPGEVHADFRTNEA
jgi:hypothetical protein